jgi:hypothetical protein
MKFETILKKFSCPFEISPVIVRMVGVKHGIFTENQQGNRDLHPLSNYEK